MSGFQRIAANRSRKRRERNACRLTFDAPKPIAGITHHQAGKGLFHHEIARFLPSGTSGIGAANQLIPDFNETKRRGC
jgi:hypothetical protein